MATGPNIIRRIEVIEEGGHHGGAWKVAYADFMTAMMAFFLLMWILSSADEQKLRGIAEYFSETTMPGGTGLLNGATIGPNGTLSASNGATIARGSELGKIGQAQPLLWEVKDGTASQIPSRNSSLKKDGSHSDPANGTNIAPAQPLKKAKTGTSTAHPNNARNLNTAASHAEDDKRFDALQADIMQAMQQSQNLRPLMKNIIFARTPEGLRIQIVDQDGKPMFANGSAKLNGNAALLMSHLGHSLAALPNSMVITGHTDSSQFADTATYDNWDLSADRANGVRRILVGAGVPQTRVTRVSGMADTQLLLADKPDDPANRRITVLLAYKAPNQSTAAPAAKITAASDHAATTQVQPSHKAQTADNRQNAKVEKMAAIQQTSGFDPTKLNAAMFENLRSALQ